MNNADAKWSPWSPRAEIAPAFSDCGGGVLEIRATGGALIYGAWRRTFAPVKPGAHYLLVAEYQTQDLAEPEIRATARVEWRDASGERIYPPDYAIETKTADGWTRVEIVSPAAAKAASAVVSLGLRWARRGLVRWRNVQLLEVPAPSSRIVRVAAVGFRPRNTGSANVSVDQFCDLLRGMPGETDLICLPEGISVIGTGKKYLDVAEPIPGPLSGKLAAVARERETYLVAGLYEREGCAVYNTAVLFDRSGQLVGKYRKTHLPQEEAESGITPGDDYPVFDTDVGKVGLLLCWDVQFPEPARALAIKGAQIILLPIWGGSELLARARAIENHVYFVTASYDMKTTVVDPTGEILAEGAGPNVIATTAVDLNRIILQLPYMGNMATGTWKERRADL